VNETVGHNDEESANLSVVHPVINATGVQNLDVMLGGGLPRGALTLIVGPPGSGKTTLASQIAFAAAQRGQRALILTALSESTDKLIRHLRGFSFFDQDVVGGLIQVLSLYQFLQQDGVTGTADDIITLVRRTRTDVLVIDGFRGIRGFDRDPHSAREFLYRISAALNLQGVTTIVSSEAQPRDVAMFPEATTADILIGIHYRVAGMRHQRLIETVKARGLSPLSGLHVLNLGADGVAIFPRLEALIQSEKHYSAFDVLEPV